jgi:uncharacterized protein YhjY with autotransporter beta-barrel domain/phospholipase/lecithinase/hemolysin
MRFSAKFLCAVASSALLIPAAAGAQRVNRIVAFGDSYADDGNLFELGVPRQPVYPNGRFSNGTNFIDTMAQILNVPVDNFAIGGAQTGNTNIVGPGIPGFALGYQSFLAGGGPAVFPRVTGKFGENDLAVVSIGGNDARAYEFALGRTPTAEQITARVAGAPAAAAVSVAQASAGLNAIVGAGAQNLTFLAGDAGRLPEVRGTPVAAIGTAFSNSYNAGIQASLAGIAASGVTVNYLDLTQIGNVVEANLSAFGLQSAGACPVACVTTNPELLDRYLFYVDQLHLTSRGFEIVGQYAVRQLEAPLTFQAQSDIGMSVANGFGRFMSGRLDLSGGESDNPLSFYLVATTASHDVADGQTTLAYDYDSIGAAAGAEYATEQAVVGLAVSYSRPETDFLSGAGRSRAEAWQIGAYGKFDAGGAFAEGYAGYGFLDYSMRRRAVIDDINARADGNSLVAGAEVGYLFEMAGAKVGPVVGVQYARAKLDDYTETGDPVLTLNVGKQRASELVGFAGLEGELETEIGGLSVRPYAKLLAEKELDSIGRPILYSSTSAPLIVNSFEQEQAEDDVYGRLEGGISFELTKAVALQLQASATVEHPEHDEVSGFLGFKIGF